MDDEEGDLSMDEEDDEDEDDDEGGLSMDSDDETI
jgi:hypothetical protein